MMTEAGISSRNRRADAAAKQPLGVTNRALENEAPHFVDYVSQLVDDKYANLLKKDANVDVYTMLDLHLQRLAQEALVRPRRCGQAAGGPEEEAGGGSGARRRRSAHGRDPRGWSADGRITSRSSTALSPRDGSRGRRSSPSFATSRRSRRWRPRAAPGLLRPRRSSTTRRRRFEHLATRSTRRRIIRTSTTGPITLRSGPRALAERRRGEGRRADRLRQRRESLEQDRRRRAGQAVSRSLALGVFEASPVEMATAHTTLFMNKGAVRAAHGDLTPGRERARRRRSLTRRSNPSRARTRRSW